jgi:YD repeat-containing protein
MYKYSLFLILFIFLLSCNRKNATNDLDAMNLKGNIKAIETFMFEADERFGEVEKGKPVMLGFGYYELIEFNNNGNKSSETEFWLDKKISVQWKILYDKQGKKIENNQYNSDGSLFIRIKYIYDKNGNIVQERRFDDTGIEMSSNVYKYDELGSLIESNELDYSYKYKYDADGNIIQMKVENHNINLDEIYKYKYDKNQNVTEEICFNNGGKIISTINYRYIFDKEKNWIKKIEYQNGKAKYVVERKIKY